MTISLETAKSYIGQTLYDTEGSKIGKIGTIYLDDTSGEPEWVTVSTGLFGTSETFVPLADASVRDDGLTVPYTKDKIKDAPNVDPNEGHLPEGQEDTLYRHYGIGVSGAAQRSDVGDNVAGYTGTTTGDNAAARSTGTATGDDDAITRSEERVNVGTETVTAGRARLRKYVETETQSVDVPVRTEKVRLESEPITDANRGDAFSGPDISEAEQEVTLTKERPVVTTEAVPVERVRLTKDVEEHTETVQQDVRKERIDLDSDQDIDERR